MTESLWTSGFIILHPFIDAFRTELLPHTSFMIFRHTSVCFMKQQCNPQILGIFVLVPQFLLKDLVSGF